MNAEKVKKIKIAMIEQNITINQLKDKLGVSRSYASRLVNGKEDSNKEKLTLLSRILKIEL